MSNDSIVPEFQNQEQSAPGHRVTVAIAATLSLTATSLLLTYVIVLFILSNLRTNPKLETNCCYQQTSSIHLQDKSAIRSDSSLWNRKSLLSIERKSWLRSWARHRLSFIKTPFGIMFMNLVLADFIQALGFGMNYFWVANLNCQSVGCQTTCTIQGVLIQLGDVASAFSNLMIAIQTFAILTFSWHLPKWITWASLALIWIPVFVLGLAAPSVMGNWSGPNPFYTWSGDWCWISKQFSPLRLFLHYLWIFVSAFASIALYGHLFLRLQIHFRRSKVHQGLGLLVGQGKTGTMTTDLVDGAVIPLQGDHMRKKLERKARAMLMYPIAFIFMILPLSAYRLASLAGHDWGITAATICGSMYCLSGFIDVVLFGTTRSILSVPVLSVHTGNRRATAVIGTNGMRMSSTSGLNGSATRSAGFRVEVVQETVIDLDEPSESERKRAEDPCRPTDLGAEGSESSWGNSQGTSSRRAAKELMSRRLVDSEVMGTRNHRGPEAISRISHPTTNTNSEVDIERSRHPSLTALTDYHLLNHPAPTDPTPWYEPFRANRQG